MCDDYSEWHDDSWYRLEADWTSYNSYREDMDYEEAARYDQYDGYGDPYIDSDCAEPTDCAEPADNSWADDCPF